MFSIYSRYEPKHQPGTFAHTILFTRILELITLLLSEPVRVPWSGGDEYSRAPRNVRLGSGDRVYRQIDTE